MDINAKSNSIKSTAGNDLKNLLRKKFDSLIENKIIIKYEFQKKFNHKGFSYKDQYLANFIIETIDNKFIIINSSNSFRSDRVKGQFFDLNGIKNNSDISDKIIASILLYPDKELENVHLINFRKKVKQKEAFSPASHILVLSELLEFIENHESENKELPSNGSYYGKRGNKLVKEIVNELKNKKNLIELKLNHDDKSTHYSMIINRICSDYALEINDIIEIHASDSVLKLKSGGNAKTDLILTIKTINKEITETISVKNTNKNVVSCHDYKCSDFIRVLGINDSKLAKYFELFQEQGSYSGFEKNLPVGSSISEFKSLLNPYKEKLLKWALMGMYDTENLIDDKLQISNYILIDKVDEGIKFDDYLSYIKIICSSNRKQKYGLPFSWTHPSNKRGERIQLKMPIIIK